MVLLQTLTLRLAGPAIKLLARLVLPESSGKAVGDSLASVVESRLGAFEERRKAHRLLEDLQDEMGRHLERVLAEEFKDLDESDRTAAALTVGRMFETEAGASVIVKANLDPDLLFKRMIAAGQAEFDSLGGDAELAATLLLRETCVFVVRLADKLPDFRTTLGRELLVRQAELASDMHRVLDGVSALRQHAAKEETLERTFETRYRRALVRGLDRMQLFGIRQLNEIANEYPLTVAYVSLSATDGGADSRPVDSALQGRRRVLIRGEAGSGKTTLMQWLAVRAAMRDFGGALREWNQLVPIYLRLRDFAKDGEFPLASGFLHRGYAGNLVGLVPAGWIETTLEKGALVLIDGLDEIPASRRNALARWLDNLVGASPGSVFAVSSRPAALGGDAPASLLRATLDDLKFEALSLEPMRLRESELLVTQWHDAVAFRYPDERRRVELASFESAMHRALRERPAIRSLASNPLLCAMMCALNWHLNKRIPDDRMTLYQTALEMLIHRRDSDREIETPILNRIGTQSAQDLLERLADWVLRNGFSEASDEDIEHQIADAMRRYNVAADSAAVLQELLERSGVLRRPEHGVVGFIHKTFLEFLGARAAVNTGDLGILAAQARKENWRETIVFAVGHAQGRTRDELMRLLLVKPSFGRRSTEADVTAVCCLETGGSNLAPAQMQKVLERAFALFPPRSIELAAPLAPAAAIRPELLKGHQQTTDDQMAACIRCAATIGTPAILDVIETYVDVDLPGVRRELLESWASFDSDDYVQRIVRAMPSWRRWVARMSSSDGQEGLLKLLEVLCYRGEHRDFAALEAAIEAFVTRQEVVLGARVRPATEEALLRDLQAGVPVAGSRITVADLERIQAVDGVRDVRLCSPIDPAAMPLLRRIPRVTEIAAGDMTQEDLDGLLGRTHLRRLTVSDGRHGLERLSALPGLESLRLLRGNAAFNSLARFASLRELEIFGTDVSMHSGFWESTRLETLRLASEYLQGGMLDLSRCVALRRLTLSSTYPVNLILPASIEELTLGATWIGLAGDLANLTAITVLKGRFNDEGAFLLRAPSLRAVRASGLRGDVVRQLGDRGVVLQAVSL